LSALGGWLAQLASVSVLALSIHLAGAGQLSGIWIGALALMALSTFEAAQPLPQAAQRLSADAEAASRLLAVIRPPDASSSVSKPLSGAISGFPQDFTLAFEQVSFSYPPEPGESGGTSFAVSDIDFILLPGRRLAIVGPSGAGKTTLVSLLLGLWETQTGQITLGGVDVRHLDLQALRRAIAVLPQDAYLFNASVRDNLRLARPQAGEAEMLAACRQAQIAELVESLPGGLDAWVGEGGARLSAGERQRLARARALLKDSPLLILDEPAAHLDALTEQALANVLRQPRPGQAVLAITHRLAGLESFDEILVLDQGRIVERGTYAELMLRQGLFWRMALLERDGLDIIV
jgi:ABC-type multidrug transport system fused ATPase/permease subunit